MKKFFLPAIIFLSLTTVSAQEKTLKSFTLKEAVDFALENNNTVKNARLGIDQAKARNLEIITQGLPQVSSSIDYSYYFKKPEIPGLSKIFSDTSSASTKVFTYLAMQGALAGDPTIANILQQSAIDSKDQKITFALSHNISAALSLTQLIFDGRYIFGIKATKDLMKTARLSSSMTEQDIRYTVMKSYYQAQAAQEAKGLLKENLTLIEKLVSDTRAFYKEGLIEELDVNRLELVQANLQSQINIQNQLSEVALANLKFQIGLPLNDEIILKDNLTELKANIPAQLSTQFDASQRVEYQLLETAITLKGYDIKQKRVGYYPSLYGFMNYGWNAQSDKFSSIFQKETTTYPDGDTRSRSPWFDQGLVGITLKIPIFDSGLKMAQVKQAKIEQIKSQNDFENFKNASDLQFRAAQSSFNSALADVVIAQKTEDLSSKIFKKNTAKFKEGMSSSFELVQSEQEFVTNQLKAIQSTLNLLNTKADLDKAMGVK